MPRKRRAKAATLRRIARPRSPGGHSNPSGAELRRANQELDAQLRELRVHQKALDRSRAEYVDLFDFAPVTYALLDTVGIVRQVNPAACRLLNVERRYLVGHPLLTFMADQDRREFLEHLRRCRRRRRCR